IDRVLGLGWGSGWGIFGGGQVAGVPSSRVPWGGGGARRTQAVRESSPVEGGGGQNKGVQEWNVVLERGGRFRRGLSWRSSDPPSPARHGFEGYDLPLWFSCTVGIALPVYSTFKAIEKRDQGEQEKWLLYWAAYGSFSLVEMFPLYYHVKFAFLVWLQLPANNVSMFRYCSMVCDVFNSYGSVTFDV
ncbi:hypothetical protein Taro_029454, partial [Colocasia esculenta]|nr:hypothetical protein [Colocasia esculenta]